MYALKVWFCPNVMWSDLGLNPHTLRYYEARGVLPLKEIKELLSLRAAPQTRSTAVRECAVAKIHDIEEKIRALQAMKKALTKLVAECAGRAPITACPVLESLDADGGDPQFAE